VFFVVVVSHLLPMMKFQFDDEESSSDDIAEKDERKKNTYYYEEVYTKRKSLSKKRTLSSIECGTEKRSFLSYSYAAREKENGTLQCS
jgi:predicted transcriptional regulator